MPAGNPLGYLPPEIVAQFLGTPAGPTGMAAPAPQSLDFNTMRRMDMNQLDEVRRSDPAAYAEYERTLNALRGSEAPAPPPDDSSRGFLLDMWDMLFSGDTPLAHEGMQRPR